MASRSFTACALSPSALRSACVGGNFLKALCCFLHGGLLSQNNRAGLNVSMELQMSSQAAECECDLVLELRWNGGPGKSLDQNTGSTAAENSTR